MENTPQIQTERLLLRRFTPSDAEALFVILKEEKTNTFLPWYPLKTLDDAKQHLKVHFLDTYEQAEGYRYAICLKANNQLIGYINISNQDSHDLGYGLQSAFWHQGIATEAAHALLERLKATGFPFITATHDVLNPRSGAVMQKLGMHYCYTYEEQCQPKNQLVTFRMYQLSLDGQPHGIYQKYWEESAVHFVEAGI